MINIDDGFLELMDENGEMKEDLKVPEGDLGKEITQKFDSGEQFLVTVLMAIGEEKAVGTKVMTK